MTNHLDLTKQFLISRLRDDFTTFTGYQKEFETVRNLLSRTVEYGESNSALVIGPPRSGKSTLISSVLFSLYADECFTSNCIIVRLDGILDKDDNIALKSATTQMQLDNVVDGKVFSSYAENLSFLLACLKSGDKSKSKSIIFILDHFDLFCAHSKQALLYNLFDIVQSAQAPLCVIGLTCKYDVLELLEKRVKSRFSHRQIPLFPGDMSFADRILMYTEFLTLPTEKELEKTVRTNADSFNYPERFFDYAIYLGVFSKKYVETWNNKVKALFNDTKVLSALEYMYDFDLSIEVPKQMFCQLLANLSLGGGAEFIRADDLLKLCTTFENDDKLQLYSDLSIMEICLLIAIKHHAEIYDRDPFNFEIILTRYRKFENSSQSRMENVERAIALKCFEHLNMLEVFVPINAAAAKVQQEFQMHKLLLTNGQIKKIVTSYPNLPTDISQWALSSLV